MASTSSASSAFAGQSLGSKMAADSEERENLEKARKQQSSWVIGAATLRLTKLCAPKCLDYERVQVSAEEKACLTECVKGLHGVNEATLEFFRDFEADMRDKQRGLVVDLASEVAAEKTQAKQSRRESRKREAGYVRM